jgi:hypothetical protein
MLLHVQLRAAKRHERSRSAAPAAVSVMTRSIVSSIVRKQAKPIIPMNEKPMTRA